MVMVGLGKESEESHVNMELGEWGLAALHIALSTNSNASVGES